MDTRKLNLALSKICNSDKFSVDGLSDRCIPYFGYSWRPIYFDGEHIQLGYDPINKVVGLMARNDWEFPELITNPEQTDIIRAKLSNIVAEPDNRKMQDLFDYLQTLKWINDEDYFYLAPMQKAYRRGKRIKTNGSN